MKSPPPPVGRGPLRARPTRWLPFAASLLLAAACGAPPELTRETAVDLISGSPAFQGPWDPGIRTADPEKMVVTRDTRRRLITVESVAVRPDGPWGMAGTTATAVFTWRWQSGPLAGFDHRSKAKLHSSRGVWKVYNEQLQEELWKAERDEE